MSFKQTRIPMIETTTNPTPENSRTKMVKKKDTYIDVFPLYRQTNSVLII